MSGNRRSPCRRPAVPAALALALTAVACAPPAVVEPDLRARFPIKVEQKTFAMAVKLAPHGGPSNARDAARIRNFARDYLRRADSPLRIATPPGLDKAAARARAGAVRSRLEAEGVRPGDIVVEPGLAPVDDKYAVVLVFRGASVQVPECGDWSGRNAFNPTNLPHTDFGCSYQRNLGLMLSDPGDLVRSEALGPADAPSRDRVIQLFRAGEPTGIAAPEKEEETAGERSQ